MSSMTPGVANVPKYRKLTQAHFHYALNGSVLKNSEITTALKARGELVFVPERHRVQLT